MKQILLVSGMACSGSSALVDVLNRHRSLLIGRERYYWQFEKHLIGPGHFERERFLDLRTGDTHKGALKLASDLSVERFDHATCVGDKFPFLFRHFDHVFEHLPNARHLYILRNPLSVAESYDKRFQNPADTWERTWQSGLDDSNESVGVVARLPEERLSTFFLVRYEDIFASVDALNGMFAAMGLAPLGGETLRPFVETFASLNDKPVPRRDDRRLHVARHADWDSYRQICTLIDARGAGAAVS